MFNDCLIKSDIYSGFVMTVGIEPNKNFSYDSEENLLNFKGNVAAVIHQYDRIPKMVEMVKKKYNDVPDNISVADLIGNKNNNIDYVYINYLIYLILIIFPLFLAILLSRNIYLKYKERKKYTKVIRNKRKKKGFKKVKILSS